MSFPLSSIGWKFRFPKFSSCQTDEQSRLFVSTCLSKFKTKPFVRPRHLTSLEHFLCLFPIGAVSTNTHTNFTSSLTPFAYVTIRKKNIHLALTPSVVSSGKRFRRSQKEKNKTISVFFHCPSLLHRESRLLALLQTLNHSFTKLLLLTDGDVECLCVPILIRDEFH